MNGLPPQAPPSKKKRKRPTASSSEIRAPAPPSGKSRSKNVAFQAPQEPKKKKNHDYEANFEEKQFVLRVPLNLADQIKNVLKEAEQRDKSKKKDHNKGEKRTDLDIDIVFGEHPDLMKFFKSGVCPQLPEEPMLLQNGAVENKKLKKQKRREQEAKLQKLMDDSGYLSDVEYGLEQTRLGRFRFHDQLYPCELVDIPTIVEAYKSIDCMTYYKAGDVSQMILVKTPQEMNNELEIMLNEKRERIKKEEEKASKKNKKKKKRRKKVVLPKMYQLRDGLTRSLKNVLEHWEKQRLNISKRDIEKMVDEFNKMMEDEDPENIQIEVLEEDINEDESSTDDESGSSEDEDEDPNSDQEEDQLMAALGGDSLSVPQRSMSGQTPSPMYSPNPGYTPSTPQLAMQNSMMSDQSLSEMSSGDEDEDEGVARNTGFLTSQQAQQYRVDDVSDEAQSQSEDEDDDDDELMAHMGGDDPGQALRNERLRLEQEIANNMTSITLATSRMNQAPNAMLKSRFSQQIQQHEAENMQRRARIQQIDAELHQQSLEMPPF